MNQFFIRVLASVCLFLSLPAFAVTPSIDVGFSPNGSAEKIILHAIDSASRSIRLAAYSFTAAPVVRSLISAKKRGVDVALIVDFKNNFIDDRSGKARAALNNLILAGIVVRSISIFSMQHSKFIVVDGLHVQTGSYNYSTSAAHFNSENVILIKDRPDVAQLYLDNWQSLFNAGQAIETGF